MSEDDQDLGNQGLRSNRESDEESREDAPFPKRLKSMTTPQLNTPWPDSQPEEAKHRDYARGLVVLGDMIHDFCLATETASEAELYDDPLDPLGRAARLIGTLEHLVLRGRQLADDARSCPSPALAQSLRECADGLSRETVRLIETLDRHRAVKAHRLAADPDHHSPI
jgi:hypothetical protein